MIVKVCGMREAENIHAVEALGIDWMGFICWKKSSRFVNERPSYLPDRCKRIGVFVNPTIDFLIKKVEELKLERIQLHGNERPDFCRLVKDMTQLPIIKAFSISTKEDFAKTSLYEDIADYFLFDTKCTTVGGSGESFDWQLLQHYQGNTPFLLAGGIGPDSASIINNLHHPQLVGIDLNSRFELSPGRKDVALLSNFLLNIRNHE